MAFDGEVADVKYIIDGKTEKQITLSRLTTIAMPHRRSTAQLRPRIETRDHEEARVCEKASSQTISNIEWLKKGLKKMRRKSLRCGALCFVLVGYMICYFRQTRFNPGKNHAKKDVLAITKHNCCTSKG